MATLRDQYKNQKDRIRKAYKDILKTGATFDKSFEEIIGPRPKKITQASVNKLQKITKDYLWRQAKKGDRSAWKERMKKREEASRKGGKAAQAKRRRTKEPEPPKPPKEPEPPKPPVPPIGTDDGSMFYENLKQFLQENVGKKSLLNELIDNLDELWNTLSKDNFSKWADESGDQLVETIEQEIRYYFNQPVRDDCHKRAKQIMREGLRKYGSQDSKSSESDTYTDESGETWMNTSVAEDDEDVFMNW